MPVKTKSTDGSGSSLESRDSVVIDDCGGVQFLLTALSSRADERSECAARRAKSISEEELGWGPHLTVPSVDTASNAEMKSLKTPELQGLDGVHVPVLSLAWHDI